MFLRKYVTDSLSSISEYFQPSALPEAELERDVDALNDAQQPADLLSAEGMKGFAKNHMFALKATAAAIAVAATAAAALAYSRRGRSGQ